ncbi:MAG: phosphatase PAP2 family protein [Planctomycetaceae bacterium]|nr:phosphatase PAP2 family protein [Planctomycetaceae bacterium]
MNNSHRNLYQPIEDYLIKNKIYRRHKHESNLINHKNIFAQQIIRANNSSTSASIFSLRNFCNDNSKLLQSFVDDFGVVRSDFKNFYLSHDNLFCFGLGLMFHAAVANTSVDQSLRNWYQDEVRSSFTDNLSDGAKILGEGRIWIPVFGIAAGVYCVGQKIGDPCREFGVVGDYSSRVFRSYLVGTPTLLLFQTLLGCARPEDNSNNSAWRFFHASNSFSGHAFMGATPFLVAASMTNQHWLRFILFVCSTFAGWSRINDDAHYFSQVALGWYVSYLAVRSVAQTNNNIARNNSNIKLFPIIEAKYIGLGLVIKR